MAGYLDGHQPYVQGASQLTHEESQSRRSTTPVTYRIEWGHTSMCDNSTDCLRPGRCTVRKRALVRSQGKQPVRQRLATLQSIRQVNPGRTADNSGTHIDDRLRAHIRGGGPRHQSTTVCFKASQHVGRLQGKSGIQLGYTWCTRRQNCQD